MAKDTNLLLIVRSAVEEYSSLDGGLLPALHKVMNELRHIPELAIAELAAGFNLSKAEVYGVISFYHDFSVESLGDYVVTVCRAEACQAQGGRAIEAAAKELLQIDFDQTSADGKVTLKSVYCLGNCVCGPNIKINERLHARVDERKLSSLVDTCLKGEA